MPKDQSEYKEQYQSMRSKVEDINSILEPKGIQLNVHIRMNQSPIVNYNFLEQELQEPIVNGDPFKYSVWRRIHGRNLIFLDTRSNPYGGLSDLSKEKVSVYSDTAFERAEKYRRFKRLSDYDTGPIERMETRGAIAAEGQSLEQTIQDGIVVHEGGHIYLKRKDIGVKDTIHDNFIAELGALMIEFAQSGVALSKLGDHWKSVLVEQNASGRYVFREPIATMGHSRLIQIALKAITQELAFYLYLLQSFEELKKYKPGDTIVVHGQQRSKEDVRKAVDALELFYIDKNNDGLKEWADGFKKIDDSNIHQVIVDLSQWLTPDRLTRIVLERYYMNFKDKEGFFPMAIINRESSLFMAREIIVQHLERMHINNEEIPSDKDKAKAKEKFNRYLKEEVFGGFYAPYYEIGAIEFKLAYNETLREFRDRSRILNSIFSQDNDG